MSDMKSVRSFVNKGGNDLNQSEIGC